MMQETFDALNDESTGRQKMHHSSHYNHFNHLQEVKRTLPSRELRRIHGEMLQAVDSLKTAESLVIKKLQEVDKYLVHRLLGYNSLFSYAVKALWLSEAQAYQFISVARKSLELPSLQKAIDTGEVTVSKASRVMSVINERNQSQWLDLLRSSTKREIEKAVAEASPRALIGERARFLDKNTLKLEVPISEQAYQKLERVRDLLAQKKMSPTTLEASVEEALEFYLKHHDPVRKAERAEDLRRKRDGKQSSIDEERQKLTNRMHPEGRTTEMSDPSAPAHSSETHSQTCSHQERSLAKKPTTLPGQKQAGRHTRWRKRPFIHSAVRHAVHLRDQGRCQYRAHPSHEICGGRRWLELHHVIPVSLGGADTPENLVTLCRAHHELSHT